MTDEGYRFENAPLSAMVLIVVMSAEGITASVTSQFLFFFGFQNYVN